MILKDRLRSLRVLNNVKQQDLAAELNLSRSTIAGYETGKRIPDVPTLMLLAEFFDVTTDYLLGRTDEPISFEYIMSKHNISRDLLARYMNVSFEVLEKFYNENEG